MLRPFTFTMCNVSRRRCTQLFRFLACVAIIVWMSLVARGQTTFLHGQVFDESGAVIQCSEKEALPLRRLFELVLGCSISASTSSTS